MAVIIIIFSNVWLHSHFTFPYRKTLQTTLRKLEATLAGSRGSHTEWDFIPFRSQKIKTTKTLDTNSFMARLRDLTPYYSLAP
jgi:tellurite resistance protein TehA-like permease